MALDNRLKGDLDKVVIPTLKKKDEDYVIIIDGGERKGKSTLAQQIGTYIDPSLNLKRICFTPDEFRHAIINAKPHECVIFDEGARGLSSKNALSEINKILISMMQEMGQKNLFVIVIIPTFYMLERYVALFRARFLIHINKKSYWRLYNKKKMIKLYQNPNAKRYFLYPIRTGYRGRFYKGYTVNEEEYRKKKKDSFYQGFKITKNEKFKEQRDILLWILYNESKYPLPKLIELCQKYKVQLKKTSISEILAKFRGTGA